MFMLNDEPKSTDQISTYLKERIQSSTKIEIANFAILWNCFERCCEVRCLYVHDGTRIYLNYDKIIKIMQLSTDDHEFINDISIEFKKYLRSKNVQYNIHSLKEYFYMSYDQLEEIRDFQLLNKNSCDRSDDLKVLTMVIKRVRNNMYHGNKEIRTLDSQIKLFELCNKLLIFILYKLGCRDIINI